MSNTIQLFGQNYNVNNTYAGLTTISELQNYLTNSDPEGYDLLKRDIAKNGINDPILYTTVNNIKLVIDGHVRLQTCIESEISNIPAKEIKENFETLADVQFWMIKNQCQRRNLTQIQKLQLAFLHEETIQQIAKVNLIDAGKGNNIEKPVDTLLEIAKIANVGRTTVSRYKKVLNSGLEDIIKRMLQEELSVTSAYNLVQKKTKDVQINLDQEIATLQIETIQSETPMLKFVRDYNEAKNLLNTNEFECLIMTKDEGKVKDFASQQPNVKYAVFIIED
ncbi:hypothetical protein ACWKWW_13555 [Chryseobacterium cucumeris]